jgi:hypothetical protein
MKKSFKNQWMKGCFWIGKPFLTFVGLNDGSQSAIYKLNIDFCMFVGYKWMFANKKAMLFYNKRTFSYSIATLIYNKWMFA